MMFVLIEASGVSYRGGRWVIGSTSLLPYGAIAQGTQVWQPGYVWAVPVTLTCSPGNSPQQRTIAWCDLSQGDQCPLQVATLSVFPNRGEHDNCMVWLKPAPQAQVGIPAVSLR